MSNFTILNNHRLSEIKKEKVGQSQTANGFISSF